MDTSKMQGVQKELKMLLDYEKETLKDIFSRIDTTSTAEVMELFISAAIEKLTDPIKIGTMKKELIKIITKA